MPNFVPTAALRAALRMALRLAVVVAFAVAVHQLMDWAMDKVADNGVRAGLGVGVLVLLLLAYVILLATPFVPGVEIGIALLMIEGAWIAPWVYLGTVAGLMLAFLVGWCTPHDFLQRLFADMGMRRAASLVDSLKPLNRAERLELMRRRLPARIAPSAVRHRYILLAVLFNLPGTAVLGGGGGIALVAGLSRLFSMPATLLTILVSVAPVPVLVYVLGMEP